MKTTLTLLAFLFITSSSSFGQGGLKVNLYAANAFDDRFDSYYDANDNYDGIINGGFQWGAGLEYMLHPNYGVEISWMQQNTTALTSYQGGTFQGQKKTNFALSSNYILLGANRYFSVTNIKLEPYFGAGFGMSIMNLTNPDNQITTNKSFFAWGLKLGSNYNFTEKIGLKVQAQLLSSAQSVGGGFYFGTDGSSVGLSSYSSILQICLGGGLVIKLGPSNKARK